MLRYCFFSYCFFSLQNRFIMPHFHARRPLSLRICLCVEHEQHVGKKNAHCADCTGDDCLENHLLLDLPSPSSAASVEWPSPKPHHEWKLGEKTPCYQPSTYTYVDFYDASSLSPVKRQENALPPSAQPILTSLQKPGHIYDDDVQYEVQCLLRMRRLKNKTLYQVMWKGYGNRHNSYAKECDISSDLLDEFHSQYPNARAKVNKNGCFSVPDYHALLRENDGNRHNIY